MRTLRVKGSELEEAGTLRFHDLIISLFPNNNPGCPMGKEETELSLTSSLRHCQATRAVPQVDSPALSHHSYGLGHTIGEAYVDLKHVFMLWCRQQEAQINK